MKVKENQHSVLERVYRFVALAALGAGTFIGIMSLITGDRTVVGTIASVVVFFAVKELW